MATTSPTNPAAPAPISNPIPAIRFREAFEETLEEIEAIDEETAKPVFTDLAGSTIRIHAFLPAIESLRPQLIALPGFNVAMLDNLERFTLAAAQSHVNFNILSGPNKSAQEVETGLLKHRSNFIATALLLETNGLIDATTVRNLRSANGHQTLAFDVMTIIGLFRRNWSAIEGKCPITEAMLVDAEDLASRMFVAIGVKGRTPESMSAAAVTRRKAFTLWSRAYDEVLRGVTYLRWHHNDIDSYTPSLSGPRKGSRSTDKEEAAAPEAPATPNVPAPSPAVVPAPGSVAANVAATGSTGLPNDEPVARG